MSVLDILGCRYGTEKASNTAGCLHNYLPFYEQFLSNLRDKPITLLEIGVDKGNSLRMWREYFVCGTIIGMDIDDKTSLRGDRIEIEIGNQTVEADLDRIAKKHGPFDVIVDDAGHVPSAQVFCYNVMLKYLKPEGLYILEDLVGLTGPFPSSECTDFLTSLSSKVMQSQLDKIESIAFSYGTSVTRLKKVN